MAWHEPQLHMLLWGATTRHSLQLRALPPCGDVAGSQLSTWLKLSLHRETPPLPHVVLDQRLSVVAATNDFAALLGYDRKQLLGMSLAGAHTLPHFRQLRHILLAVFVGRTSAAARAHNPPPPAWHVSVILSVAAALLAVCRYDTSTMVSDAQQMDS
jgi:hypothetical protein